MLSILRVFWLLVRTACGLQIMIRMLGGFLHRTLFNGYTYLGERTGPIKPLSQPLKRNFLPRPGHFNKRALPPHHF